MLTLNDFSLFTVLHLDIRHSLLPSSISGNEPRIRISMSSVKSIDALCGVLTSPDAVPKKLIQRRGAWLVIDVMSWSPTREASVKCTNASFIDAGSDSAEPEEADGVIVGVTVTVGVGVGVAAGVGDGTTSGSNAAAKRVQTIRGTPVEIANDVLLEDQTEPLNP